jgi:quercetin dioxygenase-like cupin family protein
MTEKVSFYRWSEQRLDKLRGGITRRFVTSTNVMIGEVHFRKNDTVPTHSHESEQFTHVIKGALRFTIGSDDKQEIVIVRTGEVVFIPSNVPHALEALEDTLEYDVFNPPRSDWIDLDSLFLRQ